MPLREIEVSRWRDPATGRFVARGRGRAERYEALQDTDTGRMISMQRGGFSSRVVVKNINQSDLDQTNGLIIDAFERTSVTSRKSLAGARRISITIRGTDRQSKEHRFKIQIKDADDIRKLDRVMMSRILDRLHARGFRPKYTLARINWAGRRTSRHAASQRKPLEKLSIRIRIEK